MSPLEPHILDPKGKNDDSGLDQRLVDDWANQGNPNTPAKKKNRREARQNALKLAERILAEMRG